METVRGPVKLDRVAVEVLKPTELPSPPQGALQVVHVCTQANQDAQQLSELVLQSPLLAVELLRVSNSAFFGFTGKITSIARAITLIGQRALRNLALCLAMKEALRPEQLPALPLSEFWEDSLRRAVCARNLATELRLDHDTAFTAGLLQDFGLLVLFYVHHNRISEWQHLAELTPEDRLALEQQLFDTTHDKVGRQLAAAWELPGELEIAIGFHHETPPADTATPAVEICNIAQCADWMAAVFTAADKRESIKQCRSLLSDRFGLKIEQINNLLAQVSDQITEAASAFGFELGDQVDFDTLIREANLRLAEENLSFQQMNWHLEHALEERDQVAAELKRELELAREVQRSLLPGDAGRLGGVVGVNVSAKAVSGDFYDFFTLRSGKIAFCIADVSGKGMNAALLMAKTSSLFHCLAKVMHEPSKLLSMLNQEITETSIHGMFVTMVSGVYDPEDGKVRLANAGHLPVIHMNGTKLEGQYSAMAPPLGVASSVTFPCEELQLRERSSLYLCTDGLTEARLAGDRRLEWDGLLDLLSKYCATPPTERLQQIIADVRGKKAAFEDDITMLLIQG